MRVSNISYPERLQARRLGQYGAYNPTWTVGREAAFKFINEEGFHVSTEGKKFPYQINDVVAADGTPITAGPITGTALSEEGGMVRIPIQIKQGEGTHNIGGQPVNATLSLWKVYNNAQYPVFQNRRLLFTVPPASPLPLDLEKIYAAHEADRYAQEAAAAEQAYAEQAIKAWADEASKQAAEDKARAASAEAAAAAQDAAVKKQAAEEAVEAAVNAEGTRNKTLLTIGGIAALGLAAYFAFKA